jgi:hypothetical protein
MSDDLRERLLASYADVGEAMVIQSLLEAEGIACRVADLAQIPSHMLGIAGSLNRSVGLYVLESDVERATSLLATLAAPENAVDEEALAAEAEAAAIPAQEAAAPPSSEPPGERDTPTTRSRPRSVSAMSSIPRAVVAVLVTLAVLLVVRGCG